MATHYYHTCTHVGYVVEGGVCPGYCDASLEFVSGEDCGEYGYCCGTPLERTCCTDYFEQLPDLLTNITSTVCANLRADMLEDLPNTALKTK